MRRPVAAFLLGLSLVAAPACGRKGPLVLPPGRAPLPVEGLTAAAGDGQVVLRWTNPSKQISGHPLGPLGAIEVWVFDRGLPEGPGPLSADRIEKTARLARKIPAREIAASAGGAPGGMTFTYALPPGPAGPAKLAFAVRALDRRGRASEFAGPVTVDILKKSGVDRAAAVGVS